VGFGGVEVIGNDILPTLTLPALTETTDFVIEDNQLLTGLELPVLDVVTGDLTVQNNPALPQCEVDALITQLQQGGGIAGTITTGGNDEVAVCE